MEVSQVRSIGLGTLGGYSAGILVAVIFGVASGSISAGASQASIFAGLPQLVFAAIGFAMGLGQSAGDSNAK